jgi:hypothetical protein
MRSRVYEDNKKYHYVFELWSVDSKRDLAERLIVSDKKKDCKD